MKTTNGTSLISGLLALSLSGCSLFGPGLSNDTFPRYHDIGQNDDAPASLDLTPLELDLATRLPMPEPVAMLDPGESEPLYSFTIANMEIRDAMRMFARAYDLNILVDSDVAGVLDVEFHSLPLKQAIPLMLGSNDYYWSIDNGIVRVRSQETRQFTVDYLRLVRSGQGSSTATVSTSGSTDSSEGTGSDSESGSVSIGHTDQVHFWEELESQIKTLASDNGKVVINRLSGTIVVRDQHSYVQAIADYLDTIQSAIHRQVDIQVSIIEVALDDNAALGVNWSRIADVVDASDAVNFSVNGQVGTPAGGIETKPEVFSLAYSNSGSDAQVSALVSALDEQGDVQVVSQPHIRTINNQTSLIKVGTDRTFFRREQSVDTTSAGSTTTASDVPQVVSEGVVLSITPQISSSGHVLMDISPVVSRVSSISTVENAQGEVQSSAPNLDVAQVTSLVRAQSGETVVIGGLIQTHDSRTERGLPGTRWMGPFKNIAGGTYQSQTKKELIMVLTPTIVDSYRGDHNAYH